MEAAEEAAAAAAAAVERVLGFDVVTAVDVVAGPVVVVGGDAWEAEEGWVAS